MSTVAHVDFFGEQFDLPEAISALAVLAFSKGVQGGVDSRSVEGMAQMYDLLQQCIAPDDWQRFEKTANSNRANGDDLWAVIDQVFLLRAERPTVRSSASPDGPQSTDPSLESDSEARAIELFPGRPDLQIAVQGVRAS